MLYHYNATLLHIDSTRCYNKICFGLKETAEWKDIRKIYVRGIPGIFLSYADGYEFVGIKGSKTFFMSGEFYKSKKLTKTLEYYAKNKIRNN